MRLDPDPQLLDGHRQRALGAATLLLAQDPTWRGDLHAFLRDELVPAFRHGKLAFFMGADEQPIGFAIWAHLGELTEARLLRDADLGLHLSEWNEGERLWLRALHLPRKFWREGLAAWNLHSPDDGTLRVAVTRKGATHLLELDPRTLTRLARWTSR